MPDLAERVDPLQVPEWMDAPCTYPEFLAAVRGIAATTRLTGAYRPTLSFLARSRPRWPAGRPVHIVDVGSGGGDMLRRIARWGKRRGMALHLTGIDLNPYATRAAAELSAGDHASAQIHWRTGDLFGEPAVQEPDLVLSSLVTHHMRDDELIRFLGWMEAHARVGWFVSDLVRSERSYRLFGPLARLMRWHPFVQHDGLVSIRRAFREADWYRLLDAAAIPEAQVQMQRCALGRLCVQRLRPADWQPGLGNV